MARNRSVSPESNMIATGLEAAIPFMIWYIV